MIVDHLVSFGSFVQIVDVRRSELYGLSERIDRFLELFEAAVREADMIVNLMLNGHIWIVLERTLERLDGVTVLLVGVIGQAKLVEEHRRRLVVQPSQKVFDCKMELLLFGDNGLVVVALTTMEKKLDVCRLLGNRFVVVLLGLFKHML